MKTPAEAAMERQLLKRLLHGDEQAYIELVERYEKPLINFIYRYVGNRTVAEDIFQETLVRMMRGLDDYRPRAGFGTWLYTIARNLCLDWLKAQRIHREVPLDAPVESDDGGKVISFRDALRSEDAPAPDALDRREEIERMGQALKRLSPKLREALVLRIFHDLPYRDIAHIARAPVGTVKFRVHEALHALARLVGESTETKQNSGTD